MLRVQVDARAEAIRPLRYAVAGIARSFGVPDSELYGIELCVGEAVTNVVVHAYPEEEPGPLDVRMRRVADDLEIVVADQGRECDHELRREHAGLGLGFLSRLTNRCTFTASPHGTRVEMRFPLPRSGRSHLGRRAPRMPAF